MNILIAKLAAQFNVPDRAPDGGRVHRDADNAVHAPLAAVGAQTAVAPDVMPVSTKVNFVLGHGLAFERHCVASLWVQSGEQTRKVRGAMRPRVVGEAALHDGHHVTVEFEDVKAHRVLLAASRHGLLVTVSRAFRKF